MYVYSEAKLTFFFFFYDYLTGERLDVFALVLEKENLGGLTHNINQAAHAHSCTEDLGDGTAQRGSDSLKSHRH